MLDFSPFCFLPARALPFLSRARVSETGLALSCGLAASMAPAPDWVGHRIARAVGRSDLGLDNGWGARRLVEAQAAADALWR